MRQSLARFDEYLQSHHLRLTPQRMKLAQLVLSLGGHLSAEDIAARARGKKLGVGRATVYRTLELLCDSGLVQPVDLGGEARLFEPMHAREHHDHLRCTGCGTIFEFESPEIEALQERIARAQGFIILSHHHEIFGLCRHCSAKARAATAASAARSAPANGRDAHATGARHARRSVS